MHFQVALCAICKKTVRRPTCGGGQLTEEKAGAAMMAALEAKLASVREAADAASAKAADEALALEAQARPPILPTAEANP